MWKKISLGWPREIFFRFVWRLCGLVKGSGQQLHEPGVHAGQNGDLLVGVFAGGILLIALLGHKLL